MNKPKSIWPTVGFIIVFAAIWTFRATVFYKYFDVALPNAIWRQIASDVIKFLIWVVPVFLWLRFVDHEKPLRYVGLTSRPNWPETGGIAVLIMTYYTGVALLLPHLNIPGLAGMKLALIALPFTPILEEILFRGFLLIKLREHMPFWAANIITSLLFVLTHWPYWLYFVGFRANIIYTSIALMALSLILGIVRQRTNSLLPPILLHLTNNFVALL